MPLHRGMSGSGRLTMGGIARAAGRFWLATSPERICPCWDVLAFLPRGGGCKDVNMDMY